MEENGKIFKCKKTKLAMCGSKARVNSLHAKGMDWFLSTARSNPSALNHQEPKIRCLQNETKSKV